MELMEHSSLVMPIARSQTLRRVGLYALLLGAYSLLAIWKEHSAYRQAGDMPPALHAALAVVLGWLLVFRTNSAYARWWEARTLWGALVNTCRNLAVKSSTLAADASDQEREELRRCTVGFAYSLRDHLREGAELRQVPGFEDAEDSPSHVPGYLSHRICALVARWRSRQCIDGHEQQIFDVETRHLLEICGGCERIRNTRVVRSYRVFARQCTLLYLLTLPWAIAEEFQWWTVPLTILTAYFMVGLETVAEHVEEPFGYDEDDLDLDGLCAVIDASVSELIAQDWANQQPDA